MKIISFRRITETSITITKSSKPGSKPASGSKPSSGSKPASGSKPGSGSGSKPIVAGSKPIIIKL